MIIAKLVGRNVGVGVWRVRMRSKRFDVIYWPTNEARTVRCGRLGVPRRRGVHIAYHRTNTRIPHRPVDSMNPLLPAVILLGLGFVYLVVMVACWLAADMSQPLSQDKRSDAP